MSTTPTVHAQAHVPAPPGGSPDGAPPPRPAATPQQILKRTTPPPRGGARGAPPPPPPAATPEQILKLTTAWLRLLCAPGEVRELRALGVSDDSYRRRHTKGGFYDYDHLEDMARAALKVTPNAV